MNELFTVGHSTHSVERLIELLSMHSVSAVADVRSSPYSRYNPQFNREPLWEALKVVNTKYLFFGKELGARIDDPSCYVDGKVQFDRIAETAAFQQGLNHLRKEIESYRVALLCAEKDPVTCHRMILVCRNLRSDELEIKHILEDGSLEDNRDAERRIMQNHNIPDTDLFMSPEELIEKAYNLQGGKIAYSEKKEG